MKFDSEEIKWSRWRVDECEARVKGIVPSGKSPLLPESSKQFNSPRGSNPTRSD